MKDCPLQALPMELSSNHPPTQSLAQSSSAPRLRQVALALLYQEGRFLMQLRDDLEHIVYPGMWGFFGGHIDPGEVPADAMRRELLEELNYVPPLLCLFSDPADDQVKRYHYYGELTVPITQLELNEGQDLALCSVEEIRAGQKYSQRLGETRALGKPHQQALLDFIESGLMESKPSQC